MTTSSGPLAEFLRDRRESLTPAQVGLSDSSRRRVRGLRRTEVAELAGISADYYLRIEQGRGHRPSAEVLSALSRALLLDVYGDEHLHRVANLSAGHEAPAVSDEVPAGIRELLDLHPETPAYLSNGTLDVIGVNEAGRLLAPGGLRPGLNLVLSVFEHYPDPHSESHWRRTASNLVASLRYHADPRSPRLRHIVDTLSATDPRFVELWQRCEVRPHTSSWPLVYIESHGWVGLRSETLAIPASRGCTMTQFFAGPNTPGVEALRDLVRRAYGREPRVEPSA